MQGRGRRGSRDSDEGRANCQCGKEQAGPFVLGTRGSDPLKTLQAPTLQSPFGINTLAHRETTGARLVLPPELLCSPRPAGRDWADLSTPGLTWSHLPLVSGSAGCPPPPDFGPLCQKIPALGTGGRGVRGGVEGAWAVIRALGRGLPGSIRGQGISHKRSNPRSGFLL